MRWFVIILFISPFVSLNNAGQCPINWISYGELCYYVNSTAELNYADADNACKELGAELTSIHSREEQDFLDQTVLSNNVRLWIGLNDIREEGTFEWLDGTEKDFVNWGPGQPDNKGGIEDCVHMVFKETGRWNDHECSPGPTYGYICKMRVPNTCELPAVTTGVVLGSTETEFGIGEKLSFSCASTESHIDGTTPLTCQNVYGEFGDVTGVLWSAAPPTCVPNTCEPPAVMTGVVLGSTETEFDIGEKLAFSCASAESHIDGTTPLTCQNVDGDVTGVWSAAPPTCVPNTCEPPAVTTDIVLGSSETEFGIGEQLSFTCASTESHIDETTPLTCQNVDGDVTGVWSAAPPTCVPNTCEPPAVTAGVVLGSTDTEFDVGEQLSFSCASTEGQIDGTTPITCQNVNGEAKGVWSSASPTCVHYPMDWVSHKELRYYINFTAKLKYGDAENACKQLGAELASIHSQEEQDFLNQTVWRYGVRLWIGLNDRREEGVYEWVDGTELDYLNWGRGQPDDNRSIEECVHIIFKETDGWNDIFCGGVQYGYICKKTVPNTCEPPAVTAGVVLGSTDTEFDVGEQLSFSCASTESHIDGTTSLTCQNVDGEATGVWSAAPPTCGNTSKPEANVTPLPIIIVAAGVGGGVLLVLITAIVITVALRRSTKTTSSVTAFDNDPDYAVPLENVGYDTYLDDNRSHDNTNRTFTRNDAV